MTSKNWEKCKLINRFIELSESDYSTKFNFQLHFENLRNRIVDELSFINQLFPEYTPHDEKYHINQLFHISDIILGDDLINNLNIAEIFILICSIYGHDWGMAVSQIEKDKILGFNNDFSEDLLLDNENKSFISFLRNKKRTINDFSNYDWQEYTRTTHAVRSGHRIRKYFSNINSGLGEAIARVCEAHWLDIEEIENYKIYPTDYSVVNHSVNIKALGIYIRLIDLYDLSEDRTPYVLWKYVSPQNPYSSMEWQKHRSIFSITAPSYSTGRIIKVDGATNNIEVWSKLKDLENWSNEQLRTSLDLLSRMNHKNHKINIFFSQWNIEAKGFNPINIQFNFERVKIFKILSDELYDKDDYVFLRELLQNSIDAIKMRIGIMEKAGFIPKNLGKIEIDLQEDEDGRQVIIWKDDGIGMDEYIVRNYLSVIGKSYYKSDDFEKLGLNIDPISKFGIGILSCFKVANKISISTRQDPYLNNSSKALNIDIPSVLHAFRVKEIEHAEIGTTVTIYVNPDLLRGESETKKLDVFEYLSRVAGFTEFPIYIKESAKISLIAPYGKEDYHIDNERKNLFKSFKEKPENHIVSKEEFDSNFNAEIINLNNLPDLEDYEGYLLFYKLKPQIVDFVRRYPEYEFYDGTITLSKKVKESDIGMDYIPYSVLPAVNDMQQIMQEDEEEGSMSEIIDLIKDASKYGLSCLQMPRYSFSNNGILISQINVPLSFILADRELRWPSPILRINLKKTLNAQINVSRTKVLYAKNNWDAPIFESLCKKIIEDKVPQIVSLKNPHEIILELSKLHLTYRIPIEILWEKVNSDNWPIITVLNNKINVIQLKDVDVTKIMLSLKTDAVNLYNPTSEIIFKFFYANGEIKNLQSPNSFITILSKKSFDSYYSLPIMAKTALKLSTFALSRFDKTYNMFLESNQ